MRSQSPTPPPEKPAWFQLIEGDQFQPRPRVNRVARALALATPLLVLGTGFLVAQNADGQGVPANSIRVASAPSSIKATPSSSQPTVAPTSLITGFQPSIAKLPSGGSNDDEGTELNDD